jgi:hypothetical protein
MAEAPASCIGFRVRKPRQCRKLVAIREDVLLLLLLGASGPSGPSRSVISTPRLPSGDSEGVSSRSLIHASEEIPCSHTLFPSVHDFVTAL